MFTLTQLLDEPPRPASVIASTGVHELDLLVGGICTGAVWVIAGRPRAGRTMFACQIARLAAQADIQVTFALGRDGAADITARLAAGATGTALQERRGSPATLADTVRNWNITFDPDRPLRSFDALAHLPETGLLVIDDLDLWVDDPMTVLRSARSWATRPGRAVVVTIPTYHLALENSRTWQEWVRVADTIVEIVTPDSVAFSLAVLSNRSGPVADVGIDAVYAHAQITTAR